MLNKKYFNKITATKGQRAKRSQNGLKPFSNMNFSFYVDSSFIYSVTLKARVR